LDPNSQSLQKTIEGVGPYWYRKRSIACRNSMQFNIYFLPF
jgi:hypothetical protein